MKKILVFGFTSTIGGVETFFMNYYRKMNKNVFSFDFVTVYDNMVFSDEIRANGGKIFKIINFTKNPFKYKSEIKSILKNTNYDIVYVNMLSAANIIPLKIAKKYNIRKIIAHSHNADTPHNPLKKILHKLNKNKISRYATHMLACSHKAGDWLFGTNKYTVINNAIDLNKFKYDKSVINKLKIKKQKGYKYIGHIGRFSEQKNHKFIIEIAKKLKKEKIIFILIGEGEIKKDIIDSIDKNNLNNIIVLDGMEDVYKYYNLFDMFILPSLFEGLPVVGIEAQANGLPCLFSDKITSELKMNENVQFLSINNAKKWADKILSPFDRSSDINVGKCGFDINLNVEKMCNILEEKDYEKD